MILTLLLGESFVYTGLAGMNLSHEAEDKSDSGAKLGVMWLSSARF